jgi:hypothetical protein
MDIIKFTKNYIVNHNEPDPQSFFLVQYHSGVWRRSCDRGGPTEASEKQEGEGREFILLKEEKGEERRGK